MSDDTATVAAIIREAITPDLRSLWAGKPDDFLVASWPDLAAAVRLALRQGARAGLTRLADACHTNQMSGQGEERASATPHDIAWFREREYPADVRKDAKTSDIPPAPTRTLAHVVADLAKIAGRIALATDRQRTASESVALAAEAQRLAEGTE